MNNSINSWKSWFRFIGPSMKLFANFLYCFQPLSMRPRAPIHPRRIFLTQTLNCHYFFDLWHIQILPQIDNQSALGSNTILETSPFVCAYLQVEQLKVIQKRIQQRRFVSGSIDPINASQQPQTVAFHVLTQREFELARKTLSQLVNAQRQPIYITKYWQILIQRHGYPSQDFFGSTSNAGTTKNKKFKKINS